MNSRSQAPARLVAGRIRYRPGSSKPDATPAPEPAALRRLVEALLLIVAPSTVLTGLLYYFGWVRTGAFFSHFGIEQRLLGFSAQDYILRSAGVAFRPTTAMALAALLVTIGLPFLSRLALVSVAHKRMIIVILAALAASALCFGSTVLFGALIVSRPLWGAVCVVVGVLALEAAVTIQETRAAPMVAALRRVITASVVLIGCFWIFAISAQASGDDLAAAWASSVHERPTVVIYSTHDLHLNGPGITRTVLPTESGGYGYRFEGLRLLIFGDGRWFLLPAGWTPGDGTTIVVREGDGTRIEVAPSHTAMS